MSKFKTAALCLGSAFVGGAIVILIILLNPKIFPEISSENMKSNSQNLLNQSKPSTENELFQSLDKYQDNLNQKFDSFFNDEFFSQDDPFEALRDFRKQMQSNKDRLNQPSFSTPFDSWFSSKFGGGTVRDIEKREDEDFVYYEIVVQDLKGTTINTKVENGYLTVTGQIESEDSEENDENGFSNRSVFSSTFSRTFPLPTEVDTDAMEMEAERNKIIIKFPKI